MIGYVQMEHEIWAPLALARKDGTHPRIFCVLNTLAAPELVKQDGSPIDFRDYEDFVLEWAEQWAEDNLDAMYLSMHPGTMTISTVHEPAESRTKTFTV